MIELMVALTVLLIGISGIMGFQVTAFRASSYARHSTEATMLAEDKMEALRTIPLNTTPPPSETINAHGLIDINGPYDRVWAVAWTGNLATITVTVQWDERGTETNSVVLQTQRSL